MDEAQTPKRSNRGGARPGAGRKPTVDRAAVQELKAEATARIRQKTVKQLAKEIEAVETKYGRVYTVAEIEVKIQARLNRLLELMMELAEGVQVQEPDKEGPPRVYTRVPDKDALKYLMDRGMGRVPERIEMLPNKEGEEEGGQRTREDDFLDFMDDLYSNWDERRGRKRPAAPIAPAPSIAPPPLLETQGGVTNASDSE